MKINCFELDGFKYESFSDYDVLEATFNNNYLVLFRHRILIRIFLWNKIRIEIHILSIYLSRLRFIPNFYQCLFKYWYLITKLHEHKKKEKVQNLPYNPIKLKIGRCHRPNPHTNRSVGKNNHNLLFVIL